MTTNLPSTDIDHNAGLANARIVYFLYVLNTIVGAAALIGVIMAYVFRADAAPWVQSHYSFQIRTFWLGLLMIVVGAFLMMVLIGIPIMLLAVVWMLIRSIKGLRWLEQKQPIPNVSSLLFGD